MKKYHGFLWNFSFFLWSFSLFLVVFTRHCFVWQYLLICLNPNCSVSNVSNDVWKLFSGLHLQEKKKKTFNLSTISFKPKCGTISMIYIDFKETNFTDKIYLISFIIYLLMFMCVCISVCSMFMWGLKGPRK